jgi:hypothetical protein
MAGLRKITTTSVKIGSPRPRFEPGTSGLEVPTNSIINTEISGVTFYLLQQKSNFTAMVQLMVAYSIFSFHSKGDEGVHRRIVKKRKLRVTPGFKKKKRS